MKILILDSSQIRNLLSMSDCIELMADALSALARGEVFQPLRTIIRPPNARGFLGLMSAYSSGEQGVFGLKAICVFPDNPTQGKDAHQGAVTIFSRDTGELLALMNASEITAIRTAAVSALATRLLARSGCAAIGNHRRGCAGSNTSQSNRDCSRTLACSRGSKKPVPL